MAMCPGCMRKGHRRGSCQQNPDRPGQHPLLSSENPHRRQNRRRTRRSAPSRNARPAAQPDAAVKEKNPTTAPFQGLKAEDAASDRAATELAPVGVHFSSTVRAPGVLLPVVQAMAYGENGKKRLVNCLLDSASEKSLIRTNVADELELSGTPSAVTVRGVHGLSARVADSRQVRFQLGQAHEEIAVSTKLELTALCIPSIPHSVYQHNQGKTKCRVVFDGSAEWNGTSLNNCLDPGRFPYLMRVVYCITDQQFPNCWMHCYILRYISAALASFPPLRGV
ncbi:hypothetical protein T12_3566 [Trichinella patagoniensis]|uniref:Uncharacterized protein n=1 Tax=Trichinella patagoniensis TaxID=990121 RepID=A0A0V1A292_9BILA|nr:hypothetical protein T12_3566 [Trichinella patagoniensis]